MGSLGNELGNRLSGAGLGNQASGAGASYQAILGPLLVEMWHASLGIALVGSAVDTWTGQIRGTVLQAPAAAQRPVYGADGSNFGGQSVVQCAAASIKCLKASGLTGFLASGSRPWTSNVVRFRDLAGTAPFVNDIGTAATDEHRVRANTGGTSFQYFLAATGTSSAGAANTNVNSLVGWGDGTNGMVAVNGVVSSGANISSLVNDVTALALAVAITTNSVISNTSHAHYLVCSAAPSAAQQAAVLALQRSEWGF